jgi:hypothetical protein
MRPDYGMYVHVPLERTYQTAWDLFPSALKGLLEPRPPDEAQ